MQQIRRQTQHKQMHHYHNTRGEHVRAYIAQPQTNSYYKDRMPPFPPGMKPKPNHSANEEEKVDHYRCHENYRQQTK